MFPFRVIVAGGGLSGLTFAHALKHLARVSGLQRPLSIKVFEKEQQPSTQPGALYGGSTVSVRARGFLALTNAGVDANALHGIACPPAADGFRTHIRMLTNENKTLWTVSGAFGMDNPRGRSSVDRLGLYNLLANGIGCNTGSSAGSGSASGTGVGSGIVSEVHRGHALTGFSLAGEGASIKASFANGHTEVGDVLIGADGIHSATRTHFFNAGGSTFTPARYDGVTLVRGRARFNDQLKRLFPAGDVMVLGSGAQFTATRYIAPCVSSSGAGAAAVGPSHWDWVLSYRQRQADKREGANEGVTDADLKGEVLKHLQKFPTELQSLVAESSGLRLWNTYSRVPQVTTGKGSSVLPNWLRRGEARRPNTPAERWPVADLRTTGAMTLLGASATPMSPFGPTPVWCDGSERDNSSLADGLACAQQLAAMLTAQSPPSASSDPSLAMVQSAAVLRALQTYEQEMFGRGSTAQRLTGTALRLYHSDSMFGTWLRDRRLSAIGMEQGKVTAARAAQAALAAGGSNA